MICSPMMAKIKGSLICSQRDPTISLSVISINQNLFGNNDPTQRRNCHYLVLFNNPVDRQSVMTVARQMYPGHTEKFMKTFEKATKYPYGYLLVDLKPFTPDESRLNYATGQYNNGPNLGETYHVTGGNTIKEDCVPEIHHSSVGTQTVHIAANTSEENIEPKELMPENRAENGHACGDLWITCRHNSLCAKTH